MTIRLLQDRYINGAVESAGTVHDLDLELESFLVQQSYAQWEGVAPTFLNSPAAVDIINGSVPVLDGVTQVPRTPVEPTINGTPAGNLLCEVGTGHICEFRYVVNPGNDVLAAESLAWLVHGAGSLFPGAGRPLSSGNINMTDVYGIILAEGGTDTAVAADGSVDSSEIYNARDYSTALLDPAVANIDPGVRQLDPADLLPLMIHWRFSSTEAVRSAFLQVSDTFRSEQRLIVTLEGSSHA
jgi:hypothetical protein